MASMITSLFGSSDEKMAQELKQSVILALTKQGYRVENGVFNLANDDRETKRQAHYLSKAERFLEQEKFLLSNIDTVKKFLINGDALDIEKIDPVIKEVKPGSVEEILFRWWNIV